MLNTLRREGILPEIGNPTDRNKINRLLNKRYLNMLIKSGRGPIFIGKFESKKLGSTSFHYMVPPKTPRGYKPSFRKNHNSNMFYFDHKTKDKEKTAYGIPYMLTPSQHTTLQKMLNN